MEKQTPLAELARPIYFDKFLGQHKIWHKNSLLQNLISSDGFHSMIFWGPSGSGKTTLANLIGRRSGRELVVLSAVSSGVKEIRNQIHRSQLLKSSGDKTLILFMDEIHRLNKAQQDVLLPDLENGSIKFIGATTENPSFEVNNAILSRSLVFKFDKIDASSLITIMKNALDLHFEEDLKDKIDEKIYEAIAHSSDGDARRALNMLEAVIKSCPPESDKIDIKDASIFFGEFSKNYDKSGDQHYDTISAFIKSIRASHPDAATHYLARMLDSGEDPVFIARRLVIAASEDIGNANPMGLLVATSGMQAVSMVGMPEARIILGQVTTYLASSPKSNRSYLAINNALSDLKRLGITDIPLHLRNAPTRLMKELGYGKEYIYPHDNHEGAKNMTYMPDRYHNRRYYEPKDIGVEKQLKGMLEKIRPTQD